MPDMDRKTRYFGKICIKHPDLNGERTIHGRGCVGCARDYAKNKAAKDRKAASEKFKKWYKKRDIEKTNARSREWRDSNKEKVNARKRELYAQNAPLRQLNAEKRRQKNNEYRKAWRQANPEKSRAIVMGRIAKKRSATPKWANLEKVKEFYIIAVRLSKETGIMHEVDHIIPLVNKTVCGLHWEGNLQVLTRTENASKNNKYSHDACQLQAVTEFNQERG